MAKSATIRARTEPDVKQKAEAVIRELGLNPSAVITMLYRAIIRRRALPFEPNATTLAAMQDADRGTNLIETESFDDLIVQLDEPDEESLNGAQAQRDQTIHDRQTASRQARVGHRTS